MSDKYPKLTILDVRDFLDSVVQNQVSDDAVKGFFLRKGYPDPSGKEVAVQDLVVEMMKASAGELDVRLERVEAEFSGRVHALLDGFEDAALGDIAFWNYLAVRFFWPFIHARQRASWLAAEGKPTDPDRPDAEKLKLERYLVGRDHYQLPLRMYLRGQAIKDGDDYSLAEVPGTDFWRSQILGVRTSQYPSLARTVARAQKARDLGVEEQRPPGRRVNRLRSNIEFALRSEAENEDLVSELWKVTDADVEARSVKKATRKKAAASKKATSKAATSESAVPETSEYSA